MKSIAYLMAAMGLVIATGCVSPPAPSATFTGTVQVCSPAEELPITAIDVTFVQSPPGSRFEAVESSEQFVNFGNVIQPFVGIESTYPLTLPLPTDAGRCVNLTASDGLAFRVTVRRSGDVSVYPAWLANTWPNDDIVGYEPCQSGTGPLSPCTILTR